MSTPTDDAQSVADVKRALLRDIDAGKAWEDGRGRIWLELGEVGFEVTGAALPLARAGLAERCEAESWWRLTDAGRAYLEAGTGD